MKVWLCTYTYIPIEHSANKHSFGCHENSYDIHQEDAALIPKIYTKVKVLNF